VYRRFPRNLGESVCLHLRKSGKGEPGRKPRSLQVSASSCTAGGETNKVHERVVRRNEGNEVRAEGRQLSELLIVPVKQGNQAEGTQWREAEVGKNGIAGGKHGEDTEPW